MAYTCEPSDYLDGPQQLEALTPETIEAKNVERTAQGLSQRARIELATTQLTDSDVDSGNYDHRQAAAESLLQEAISKASKATNPADRAKWSAESERIAAGLVGHQLKERNTETQQIPEESSAFEELKNESVDVEGVLAWAGQELSDESLEGFNKLTQSKDKKTAKDAVMILGLAQTEPHKFVHMDSGDFTPISHNQATDIAAEFGDEVAKIIHTTSHAIQEGHAKPADVIAMYQRNIPVRKAVLTLLRRGDIKLAL